MSRRTGPGGVVRLALHAETFVRTGIRSVNRPFTVYVRPPTLASALDHLRTDELTVVAGGTDFYPGRAGRAVAEAILDIGGIAELRGITEHADHWRIGATTTWTDLVDAPLPPLFDALVQAARDVGGVQIQNAGTLAGNLCNASPAADGVPPLLALDATVELRSLDTVSRVPLADFILGPRSTRLGPDQLVTAILVARPRHRATSRFAKLGARRYLVISIVSVAACLEVDADGRIARAGVAVGACSPVARRLPALEAALAGLDPRCGLGDVVTAAHVAGLAPLDDVRATRGYRLDAARTLVARVLDELGACA
jgi:CO/xanthine dehydrogenase FAD-binding subunit